MCLWFVLDRVPPLTLLTLRLVLPLIQFSLSLPHVLVYQLPHADQKKEILHIQVPAVWGLDLCLTESVGQGLDYLKRNLEI